MDNAGLGEMDGEQELEAARYRQRRPYRRRHTGHRQAGVGVEITPFDSTGIALQDSAMMPVEYERAAAVGVGVEKKMILT